MRTRAELDVACHPMAGAGGLRSLDGHPAGPEAAFAAKQAPDAGRGLMDTGAATADGAEAGSGTTASAAAASASRLLHEGESLTTTWAFTQSFGDDSASSDDLITAMAFSADGAWLAAGDDAGRVCVFREDAPPAPAPEDGCEAEGGADEPPAAEDGFEFWFEFQSHDKDFDSLRSKMIDERVRQVCWLDTARPGPSRLLLASNTKTIKLWQLSERRGVRQAVCRRSFGNAHSYDIHSVSPCSDGETFLSADDLRVNLWHLGRDDTCFTALDAKPSKLDALEEVLTTASYHPRHCATVLIGSSAGRVRVYDMRERALLTRASQLIQAGHHSAAPPQGQNGATSYEGVAGSVTHAGYVGSSDHLLCTRDFLTLKVWDTRNCSAPVSTAATHDYLEPYLPELYENGCVFDSFSASASSDGRRIVTGSYGNRFVVHDTAAGQTTTIVAQDEDLGGCTTVSPGSSDAVEVDLARKALHTLWHPRREVLAVAAVNKVYFYGATNRA